MKHPPGARGPLINSRALRAIRLEAGLTQAELGKLANVDPSHVSRIESGQRTHPAPRVTKSLARALGCPMSTLLASEHAGAQQ